MTKGGGDAEDGGGTKVGEGQSRRRLLNLVALQLLVGVPHGIQLSFIVFGRLALVPSPLLHLEWCERSLEVV